MLSQWLISLNPNILWQFPTFYLILKTGNLLNFKFKSFSKRNLIKIACEFFQNSHFFFPYLFSSYYSIPGDLPWPRPLIATSKTHLLWFIWLFIYKFLLDFRSFV